MLPGTFLDKVTPDNDFADEAVQCDFLVVEILLQVTANDHSEFDVSI